MNELISVIIPTYKGNTNLSRAVYSVLNQSYKNIEIIIVDDNNPNTYERYQTELLVETYDDPRIKYIKHDKNKNGAAARNTGIYNSKGDYITFLDDDDFMFPNRLEKLLNKILKNKTFDGIYSNVILTYDNEIFDKVIASKSLEYKDILLNQSIIGTGSNIFISRKVLEYVKGFDEEFLRYQDLEFMIRVCKNFKVLNIDEFLVVKASNGTNNLPNYDKLKKMNEMYCSKFKKDIESLSREDIKNFYTINSGVLYYYALDSNSIKNVNDAKKDLEQFRKLTSKEYLYYILVYFRVFSIVKKIKLKYRKIKNISRLKVSYLSDEELNFVKSKI